MTHINSDSSYSEKKIHEGYMLDLKKYSKAAEKIRTNRCARTGKEMCKTSRRKWEEPETETELETIETRTYNLYFSSLHKTYVKLVGEDRRVYEALHLAELQVLTKQKNASILSNCIILISCLTHLPMGILRIFWKIMKGVRLTSYSMDSRCNGQP